MHDKTDTHVDWAAPVQAMTPDQLVIVRNVLHEFGVYLRYMLVNGMEEATTEQILTSFLETMSKAAL